MANRHQFEYLPFQPLFGLSSPHAQTVLGCFSPAGAPPPSTQLLVSLEDGDTLVCEVSTPRKWEESHKTVLLVHGMGGSHESCYMIRFSRKLYRLGYRAIRVNMRGCGSGTGLAHRLYHGGVSNDVLETIKVVKKQTPNSPIALIGFSLGGNIALKLAGELGEEASNFLETTIAICPPVDLAQTAAMLARPENKIYNSYYMRQLKSQAARWVKGKSFSNIYEFDTLVTAPNWGFKGPFDYYQQCSSCFFLPKVHHSCHLLFAEDDPFIDYRPSVSMPLDSCVKVWVTPYGGHLGFLGWAGKDHYYFWMDSLLQQWID